MNRIVKYAAAASLTGALALAAATPSQAHGGRWGAAAIGFGAGALIGAAAASAAYNNGYYYYGDGYGYEPGYAGYAYDYDAGPGYVYAPGPTYYYGAQPYYYRAGPSHEQRCTSSPASSNFGTCN
jgi:hypothetical protein